MDGEGLGIAICRETTPPSTDFEEGKNMEPVKFATLPAFKVMGMKYYGNKPNQKIK